MRRRQIITVVLLAAVGCVAHPSLHGFLIAGDDVPEALGLAPGDTIFEISPSRMEPVVIALSDTAATARGYVGTCNRFFFSGENILISFSHFCGDPYGQELDSREFLLVTNEGSTINQILWNAMQFSEMVPYLRLDSLP